MKTKQVLIIDEIGPMQFSQKNKYIQLYELTEENRAYLPDEIVAKVRENIAAME